MSGTLTIYRRELAGLFRSPLGWLVLVLALFVVGLGFFLRLANSDGDITGSLHGVLGGGMLFWFLLVLLPSLLAMRLLAEESRAGTLEYLLTAPVSDTAVIVGKYLAATTFMAVLWSSALMYGGVIQSTGVAPDWAALVCTYIGAVLASSLFVALGLFASSWTSTPLLAAFFALIATLLWLILPLLAQLAMGQITALFSSHPAEVETVTGYVNGAVGTMNVFSHFQNSFRLGVFDTAELVFFLTWPAFFLFLTVRILEARRWRG